MGTSADKLNRLIQTKAEIKNAIIEKGVEVDSSTPFKDYANKIKEISGGGGKSNVLDLGNWISNYENGEASTAFVDASDMVYKLPDNLITASTGRMFWNTCYKYGASAFPSFYGTLDLNNLESITANDAFYGFFSGYNINVMITEGILAPKLKTISGDTYFGSGVGDNYNYALVLHKKLYFPELSTISSAYLKFSGYSYGLSDDITKGNIGLKAKDKIIFQDVYMPKLEYSNARICPTSPTRKFILPSYKGMEQKASPAASGRGSISYTSCLERFDLPALEELSVNRADDSIFSGMLYSVYKSQTAPSYINPMTHLNFTGLKRIGTYGYYSPFGTSGIFSNNDKWEDQKVRKISFPKLEELIITKNNANQQPFYRLATNLTASSSDVLHIYFPSLKSITSTSSYNPFYQMCKRQTKVHFPVNCPEKEKIQAYTDWTSSSGYESEVEILFDLDGILEFTGDPYWYELWIDGVAENLVVPYLNQQSFYCIDTQNQVYTTGSISSKGTIDLDSMLKNYNKVTYRVAGNRNDLEGWYTVEGHTYPIINNGDGTYETRHSSLGNSHELTYKFIGKGIDDITGTINVGTSNMTVNVNVLTNNKSINVIPNGTEGQTYPWRKSTIDVDNDETSNGTLYYSTNAFTGKSSSSAPAVYSTMKVEIEGYDSFSFKILDTNTTTSNYCMVSSLDAETVPTSYTNAYYHTRNSNSTYLDFSKFGTVTFNNIPSGKHYFYVTFMNDSTTTGAGYLDTGYIILPKYQ